MVTGETMHHIFDAGYIINKSGEIRSFLKSYDYPLPISQKIGTDGYPCFHLSIDGVQKTIAIHRLLAITFIPNPENKPQVNHKNGNKLDYSLGNLEWTTPSENMQHAFDTGLCKPPKQPRQVIDTSTGIVYPTIRKAAAGSKISYSNCKKYLLGLVKNKTSLKYV